MHVMNVMDEYPPNAVNDSLEMVNVAERMKPRSAHPGQPKRSKGTMSATTTRPSNLRTINGKSKEVGGSGKVKADFGHSRKSVLSNGSDFASVVRASATQFSTPTASLTPKARAF